MTKDIEKMDLLKVLMDIYWSMWSLAKVSCGETDGEIYKYSYERFNREIENFNKIIK